MAGEIGRRELIKLTAAAAVAARAASAATHRFLTNEEYALVDELTEIIIPADEKSGGAKAAAVADFIDQRLAEAFDETERTTWRKGLALVDAISQKMHGASFAACSPAQRHEIVSQMAANEQEPAKAEEVFFREVKSLTILGYYTSNVGIHDDMGYLGNTLQQKEYAGELPEPSRKP